MEVTIRDYEASAVDTVLTAVVVVRAQEEVDGLFTRSRKFHDGVPICTSSCFLAWRCLLSITLCYN